MSGAEIPAAVAAAEAVGGTALGTSAALGTGATLGAGGITGLTAPATFGALAGMEAAAAPGMAGALGSGLGAAASTAPELTASFANPLVASSFSTPFTVLDAAGKAGNGIAAGAKASATMRSAGMDLGAPKQQPMQARPLFQGDAPRMNPFANAGQQGGNGYLQLLKAKGLL